MLKTWSENRKLVLMLALVGIIAFLVSKNILNAFFTGEDEATYLRLSRELLGFIQRFDFGEFASTLQIHDHPPLPMLMVTPFIYVMGYTEAALRMPNVLLWTLSCVVAAWVGWKIGGLSVGFISGMVLAVSGIFDIEALGLGIASEVLFVLLLIAILLDDFEWNLDTPRARRQYWLGGIYLGVGYLFFTSITPVIVVYHLLFCYKMLKVEFSLKTFRNYILHTLPVIIFYLAYNIYFLAIPAYHIFVEGVPLYGQLRQNLGRANTGLNIGSFLVNLRILNWYVFPFAGWLVLFLGIYRQFKKYFDIFLILAGYGAIWSFFLSGNTGHHFLAYFCWAVPFGIDTLLQPLKNKKIIPQVISWAAILGCLFAWTYIAHIKTYTFDSYPRSLLSLTWGEDSGWTNNITRPMHEIALKLTEDLRPKEKYISTIDGALNLYYFPYPYKKYGDISALQVRNDPGGQCYVLSDDTKGSGEKIRAVVLYTTQNICPEIVENVIQYPGSNIKLAILLR